MSTLGHIVNPIFEAIAWLLSFYYSLIPNYAVAIALLTITVMVVVLPLTIKSTRSMIEMQRLQPEIARIQKEFKEDKLRQQQELSALFKERGVSPAGGCLPLLIQLPVFLILYQVVRGLTNVTKSGKPDPKYIGQVAPHSLLYHNLLAAHGQLEAFGINMAKSPLSVHSGFLAALPFWTLVAVSIILQYVQYKQMVSRYPRQQTNPQMQQMQNMQKYFPLLFGIIYIEIPAAVTVYFIVSSICRIIQQTLMYRFDPKLREALEERRAQARTGARVVEAVGGGTALAVGARRQEFKSGERLVALEAASGRKVVGAGEGKAARRGDGAGERTRSRRGSGSSGGRAGPSTSKRSGRK